MILELPRTSTYFDIRRFVWGYELYFECQGCMCEHFFTICYDGRRQGWEFNGDLDKPTFDPALRINRLYNKRGKLIRKRCFLKLIDGLITYSVHSDHILAGRTVALVPWQPDNRRVYANMDGHK